MSGWRPIAIVAAASFAVCLGTLGLAAASGMPTEELGHLGQLLLPALLVASVVTAIAARRQAAAERERLAEEQRRDLLIAVSHDLRTPLAGLRAAAEAIDDRVVDDRETLLRYVAEMRSAVDSLVALVDDLFELTQIDAGAILAGNERARLADVIGTAVATCDPEALGKGLAVETALNGAGDAACSPRLTRVVQNLLQNAIRHTPPDGTVRVEAWIQSPPIRAPISTMRGPSGVILTSAWMPELSRAKARTPRVTIWRISCWMARGRREGVHSPRSMKEGSSILALSMMA